jgi:hypothetical protein
MRDGMTSTELGTSVRDRIRTAVDTCSRDLLLVEEDFNYLMSLFRKKKRGEKICGCDTGPQYCRDFIGAEYFALKQKFSRAAKTPSQLAEEKAARDAKAEAKAAAAEAEDALIPPYLKTVKFIDDLLVNESEAHGYYTSLLAFATRRLAESTPPSTAITVTETQREEIPVDELDGLTITYGKEVRCIYCNDSFVPLNKNDATQVCAECAVEHARQVA